MRHKTANFLTTCDISLKCHAHTGDVQGVKIMVSAVQWFEKHYTLFQACGYCGLEAMHHKKKHKIRPQSKKKVNGPFSHHMYHSSSVCIMLAHVCAYGCMCSISTFFCALILEFT